MHWVPRHYQKISLAHQLHKPRAQVFQNHRLHYRTRSRALSSRRAIIRKPWCEIILFHTISHSGLIILLYDILVMLRLNKRLKHVCPYSHRVFSRRIANAELWGKLLRNGNIWHVVKWILVTGVIGDWGVVGVLMKEAGLSAWYLQRSRARGSTSRIRRFDFRNIMLARRHIPIKNIIDTRLRDWFDIRI